MTVDETNGSQEPADLIDNLVRAFGGTSETARLAGVSPAAVSNWKTELYIPERHHYRLDRAARERGIEVNPAVFELRKPAA